MANLPSLPPTSGVGGGKASNGFLPLETHHGPLNTASQRPQAAPFPREELFPTFVFWELSVQSLGVFLAVLLSLKIENIKDKKKNI